MHLSLALEEEDSIHNADAVKLYGSMVSELKSVRKGKSGQLFFTKLWDSVAPGGNIYRHVALEAERMKHCEDIWRQLNDLAANDKMDSAAFIEEFLAAVRDAPMGFEDTRGRRRSQASEYGDADDQMYGFSPLEEFLATKTWRLGWMVFPADIAGFRQRVYSIVACILVCWLQVTAPVFIFINQYLLLPDRLKSFEAIFHAMNWREMMCLGTGMQERLHTMMGIALLMLLLLILTNYAFAELDGLSKSRHLPIDRYWIALGNITNIWVTVVTGFAAPVLFWNESTPTSMSMDALTLLWIFTLDDFSSYAYNIIMRSDEDFQRSAAWTKALLGQCPVRLADLRDAAGNWHFKFGQNGMLLKADGQPCLVRFKHTVKSSSRLDEEHYIELRRTPNEVTHLPHAETSVFVMLWHIVGRFFYIAQFAMPFVWFIVNKPCLQRDQVVTKP